MNDDKNGAASLNSHPLEEHLLPHLVLQETHFEETHMEHLVQQSSARCVDDGVLYFWTSGLIDSTDFYADGGHLRLHQCLVMLLNGMFAIFPDDSWTWVWLTLLLRRLLLLVDNFESCSVCSDRDILHSLEKTEVQIHN